MERTLNDGPDDALQTKIAKFLGAGDKPQSVNGDCDLCLGTTLGLVRKQNQDRALIAFARYSRAPERSFILGVVCDGIGGLAKGDEAAVLALSTFVSRVLRTPKQPPTERIRAAAMAANRAVYKAYQGRSGATISAVMIRQDSPPIGVNIGDSRIYGITTSRDLKQLSIDDTLAQALGNQRSLDVRANQLIQFVGMGDDVEPHVFDVLQINFDSLLVTTDGTHNVPSEAFAQAIRIPSTNLDLLRRLLTISDALGGRDNATALLVPTRITHLNDQPQQGLGLEFWSVSDRLEIWIPLLAEEYRQADIPSSFAEVSDVEPNQQYEVSRRNQSARAHGGKRRRKRQSAKAPKDQSDDTDRLPLDITFPDKSE
jgi:serine/threonine protein phosphatase PrpC